MKARITILIVIVLILGYFSFAPLKGVDICLPSFNGVAAISNSTGLDVDNAMNKLGIREISLDEFGRQLNHLEREFNNLFDTMLK